MSLRSLPDDSASGAHTAILGEYELVSEIAAGGLTTLHRARRVTDGQAAGAPALAIKRLQYRHLNVPHCRALLLAGGRTAAEFQAPNLVRVFEVREEPEPFVVMEFVEGMSLAALLAAAALAQRDAARHVLPILADALDGLQVLHNAPTGLGEPARIVHGAPYARHILAGADGVGRLVDLTHAIGPKLPSSARGDERLEPSHMAPEQALSPAHVDPRCDLFVIGTLLWEVLTGQPLFAADDRDQALQRMLRRPIAAPSEAGSKLGAGFDQICMRALQRSRAERYGSAAEMARAIREQARAIGCHVDREEVAAFVRSLRQPTPADGPAQPAPPPQELAGRPAAANTQEPGHPRPLAEPAPFRPARPAPARGPLPPTSAPEQERMPSRRVQQASKRVPLVAAGTGDLLGKHAGSSRLSWPSPAPEPEPKSSPRIAVPAMWMETATPREKLREAAPGRRAFHAADRSALHAESQVAVLQDSAGFSLTKPEPASAGMWIISVIAAAALIAAGFLFDESRTRARELSALRERSEQAPPRSPSQRPPSFPQQPPALGPHTGARAQASASAAELCERNSLERPALPTAVAPSTANARPAAADRRPEQSDPGLRPGLFPNPFGANRYETRLKQTRRTAISIGNDPLPQNPY